MTIEVKNSIKPLDYIESINALENRVNDVFLGRKKELLWILEHNTVYTGGTSSNHNDLINKCDKYTQYKWEALRQLIGTDNLSDKQKIVDMAKKDMYIRKKLLCQ